MVPDRGGVAKRVIRGVVESVIHIYRFDEGKYAVTPVMVEHPDHCCPPQAAKSTSRVLSALEGEKFGECLGCRWRIHMHVALWE